MKKKPNGVKTTATNSVKQNANDFDRSVRLLLMALVNHIQKQSFTFFVVALHTETVFETAAAAAAATS